MRKNMSILLWVFLLAIPMYAFPQNQDPAQNPPKEQPKEQAKDTNISGTWEMVVQTSQGEMPPSDATFAQEKETLKVTMSGPQGTVSGAGTIKEGAVQWSITISGPQGDFTIVFKGKVDGDKMSGDALLGEYGSLTWTAKKKK